MPLSPTPPPPVGRGAKGSQEIHPLPRRGRGAEGSNILTALMEPAMVSRVGTPH